MRKPLVEEYFDALPATAFASEKLTTWLRFMARVLRENEFLPEDARHWLDFAERYHFAGDISDADMVKTRREAWNYANAFHDERDDALRVKHWLRFKEEYGLDWEKSRRLIGWTKQDSRDLASHQAMLGLMCLLFTRAELQERLEEVGWFAEDMDWFIDSMVSSVDELQPEQLPRMAEIFQECLAEA